MPAINRASRLTCLLLLLAALAACQASPPAAAPTSAPEPATPTSAPEPAAPTSAPEPAAPTSAPEPAAPTSAPAPTSPPAPAALLPGPLYFLSESNQVWRIERDGQRARQLTFEPTPLFSYAVAPNDGALAYLVGTGPETALVLLDAGGRSELLRGPISSPHFTPDGAQIVFQIEASLDGSASQASETGAGIFAISRAGGPLTLLQASDPIADPNNPPDDARQFYPVAFSPDRQWLLVGYYYPVGESGAVAVKRLSDGTVTPIAGACCEASWGADGASLIIAGGTIIQDAVLGLWRADPRTGAAAALLSSGDSGSYPLVKAAKQAADGTIYAFVKITAEPSIEGLDRVQPHRVQPDGALVALRASDYLLADAIWADDLSGAAIADATAEQPNIGALAWLPTDGGPAVSLGARGWLLSWGPAGDAPPAGACARFRPLAWQPANARSASPAVADLQGRLLALGYAQVGAADGFYGDQTQAALREFQQASGLGASGDLDCATWAALQATLAAR